MSRSDILFRAARLLFRRRLDFKFDRVVFHRRSLSGGQVFNFLMSRLESRLRVARPVSYPIALQLEPTTHCQLACALCPRTNAIQGAPAHMRWRDYERLMDEVAASLVAIAFWQWGEPLLHPCIVQMVREAHERGILTFLSTNAQSAPEEFDLTGLLRSGLDMLIVSMDGVTQETYRSFRTDGDVEKVRQFTRAITRTKRDLGLEWPVINVRAIATSGNEAEIRSVREFAHEAGADLFSVKSVSLYYEADPRSPSLPRQERYRSFQYRGNAEAVAYAAMPNLCTKPWAWPTLRQDGTLLLCECDHSMSAALGNVFEAGSFREVWRSTRAGRLRKEYGRDGRIGLEFCRRCRYKLDDAIREVDIIRPPDVALAPLEP